MHQIKNKLLFTTEFVFGIFFGGVNTPQKNTPHPPTLYYSSASTEAEFLVNAHKSSPYIL